MLINGHTPESIKYRVLRVVDLYTNRTASTPYASVNLQGYQVGPCGTAGCLAL